MNLTTVSISGLALAAFAVAIAARATERPPGDTEGWRHLPPPPAVAPARPPVDEERAETEERELQRVVRRDDRARREAAEALASMRHARRRLAATQRDEVSRSYWDSRRRTAALRLASACRERRQALDALHTLHAAHAAEVPHDR